LGYAHAQFGQFGTGVYLSTDGGGTTNLYKLSGNVYSSTPFQGENLGTFEPSSGFLQINGGRMLSWKGGNGNVCGGTLRYAVYPLGDSASTFGGIGIAWGGNCPDGFISPEGCGGNDQVWNTQNAAVDLTVLPAGTYVLEVYVDYTGSNSTSFQCDETQYDNNGGSNYMATFTLESSNTPSSLLAAWANPPGTNGVEATMDDEVVDLTISGGTFIAQAVDTASVTVVGSALSSGVSLESVTYINDSLVQVALAWDGTDYDVDRSLLFTVAGSAYNGDSVDLSSNLTLAATVEASYSVEVDSGASFFTPLTITFRDEDSFIDFYTDNQDTIFMEIALQIDGQPWQDQFYLQREYSGGPILLDGSNDDLALVKQPDGSYQTSIDPLSWFGPQAEGSTIEGFNILFFNQFHTDASVNNITDVLFIDLVDAVFRSVYLTPEMPNDTTPFTLTFEATGTALDGASKVYLHSGLGIEGPGSGAFNYTVGNWGQDDGVGEMTKVPGTTNTWEINMASIEQYYGKPTNENAFALNFLFRSADGNTKVDNDGANYQEDLEPGNYFLGRVEPNFVALGDTVAVQAIASAPASWQLYEQIDTTWVLVDTMGVDTLVSFYRTLAEARTYNFRIVADFGSESRYRDYSASAYTLPVDEARPAGTLPGVNYIDSTTVTLVLHTPTATNYSKDGVNITGSNSTTAKQVIHLIGDLNNWTMDDAYQLKRDGDYWWITLTGLTPGQSYVFQYLVDGDIRIADPYANQIADFDDQYISAEVYPSLPAYPFGLTEKRAFVINTYQPEYTWEVTDFTPANINELNIYEMHFRDFTEEGTYKAATDRLDYIKELGINAIHVMPVSEFEGNSSWGYNPNFYFAADKAYGTPNDLKRFIDEAHKRDIAVFNDIVLNHAFGSNVMGRLYWDDDNNRPAVDNPWFNAEHKAVYDQAGHWGIDWNHESEHTQAFVDSVLKYWLTEFNFDGFRFDFTKGFTQTAPDPGDPWASSIDTDRQTILFRMVNTMKANKPTAITIFEHLAEPAEDKVFADAGILMWSGVGHHNQVKALNLGYSADDKDIYTTGVYNSTQWNFTFANLVSYAESHDEERQAYEVFTYGDVVKDMADPDAKLAFGIERLKGGLAINLMLPGPRMMWQFQELAYDYSINFNGRTGEKPVRWDYFESADRREMYRLSSQLLQSRLDRNWYAVAPDYGNIGVSSGLDVRRMMLNDGMGNYMIIVTNPDPRNAQSASFSYPVEGTWYQNNGDPLYENFEFTVDGNNVNNGFGLGAGQTMVLTTIPLTIPGGDDDGDGVGNLDDLCPNTPAGIAVDASGCPLDGMVFSLDGCTGAEIMSSDSSVIGLISGNPLRSAGYVEQALNFDGNDDVINLGTPQQVLFNQSISVALWVNPKAMNGKRWLVGRNPLPGEGSWLLRLKEGVPELVLPGVSNNPAYSMGTALPANTWSHVAFTFSQDTVVAYLNGNEVMRLGGATGSINDLVHLPVTIGRSADGMGNNVGFVGLLDEINLTAQVLTVSEIVALASVAQNGVACGVDASTLVGAWSFDNCNGTPIANSEVPGTAGVLVNGAEIDSGYAAQGLWLDGANDQVALYDTTWMFDTTAGLAYSLWVYPTRANGNRETILSRSHAGSIVIALDDLYPQVSIGGLAPAQWVYSGTALPQNAWSHLAVSYSGGTITLYINGTAVQSQSGLSGTPNLSSGYHKVGARWDNTRAFAGRVDELRIFNTGLTAEMAQEEFSRVSMAPAACPVILPAAAAIYQFNDCDANTAFDSLGATDGAIVGATKGMGYDQTGITFDGNDYVNLDTAPALQLTTGATFAAWVKTSQSSGTGILLTDNYNGSNWSYTLYLRNGVPHLGLGTGVPAPQFFSMGQGVADGTWHHIAFTYGGGRVTAFLDGTAVNTWNNVQGAIIPNATTEVWIGGRAGKPRFYVGSMDELRIFDQALAPEQVAQLAALAQNSTDCNAPRSQWDVAENLVLQPEVSVYPNPTTGQVKVTLGTSLDQEAQLIVTNLMGQTVYRTTVSRGVRELSFQLGAEVEAGIYLVNVITDAGRSTQRLVKN